MHLLFVCLGNICRSPAAAAACRELAEQRGMEGITVASCGTGPYQEGLPPDRRMQAAAGRRGFAVRNRSSTLDPKEVLRSDVILAMDRGNLREVKALAEALGCASKVHLFRDFDPEGSGDLPDPYFGDDALSESVMEIIMRTCTGLLDYLDGASD